MNAREPVWRIVLLACLVAAVAAVGPYDALAEEACEDAGARAKAARDQQMKNTDQFLTELNLTRSQARKLIPIAEKAATLFVDGYEQQAELMPQLIEAYEAFAEEDRINQGFSRKVERQTGRVHHREIVLRDQHAQKLIDLEEEAIKVLNSSQRETAESFRPGKRHFRREISSRARRRRQRRTPAQEQLQATRQQLHKLHEHKHPRTGNLGKYLLHPSAISSLCGAAGLRQSKTLTWARDVYEHGTRDYPIDLCEEQRSQVRDLHGEINNWNLINGLHLNEEQIRSIAGLYESATPRSRRSHGSDSAPRPSGRMLASLESTVEGILNPGQLAVLSEYKPCLIPPKNLKDPVRIGQASDSSRHEKWLARARKLPRKELHEAIKSGMEREAKHLGGLSPSEQRKRRALLLKTVREAARMSDTDFELSRAELAQRIAPADQSLELGKSIDSLTRQLRQPGRIARMMLKPDFIEQLRQRGEQLAAGVQQETTDLSAGPQAENCDESCAINPKKPKFGKSLKKNRKDK